MSRDPLVRKKYPSRQPNDGEPTVYDATDNTDSRPAPRRPQIRGGIRQQQVRQYDTVEIRVEEDLQAEKCREIKEIEEGVRDMKECYHEFNNLVQAQQDPLNKMEKNIDKSLQDVEKGTEQLHKANESQKSSRKKMCCLLGIITIVVAVIIVAVVVIEKK